jgi:hypothetical protein
MTIFVDPEEERGEQPEEANKPKPKKKARRKKAENSPAKKPETTRADKKKKDEGIPEGFPNQCRARVKHCSNCEYDYEAGDKSWKCPKCGHPRRCQNKAIGGRPTCRMHGGKGGRPPGAKYVISSKIKETFNRVFNDPTLWNLAENQAVLGARFEELTVRLDEVEEESGGGVDASVIFKLARSAKRNIWNENYDAALDELDEIMEYLEPEFREQYLWRQIYEAHEVMRRNADSHKRFLAQQETKVSVAEVVEALALIQQVAFVFIPEARDRKAFVRKLREYIPADKDLIEAPQPSQVVEGNFKN